MSLWGKLQKNCPPLNPKCCATLLFLFLRDCEFSTLLCLQNLKYLSLTKGTEIFVGKVPRDIYEWELVPIFEKYGVIYELRLMMDFSGTNRGYLFVRYSNNEEAKRAVKFLNNFEIRPGKKIGVIPSVDNRKLWISGLPKNRTSDEILQEMQKLTIGATNVVIYSSYNDKVEIDNKVTKYSQKRLGVSFSIGSL